MQTAPKGTYVGMLHCAGGILKNEGPLAFYKVWMFCHFLFANFELILLVIRELWRHCWELVSACPFSLVLWNMRSEYLQVRTLLQVEGVRAVKHSLVNNSLYPVFLLVFRTELFLVLLNISVFVSHMIKIFPLTILIFSPRLANPIKHESTVQWAMGCH
jgi:hypothetical protein